MSIGKVAKLAGVSSSTVSRVINNHPRVAPETAAAVRKAMAELSYVPSDRRPGPKPASRGRSGGNIAFYVIGTTQRNATPGFSDLLRGVSQGASQADLHLTFAHLTDPGQLPSRSPDQRIEGVILHGIPPVGEALERLQHMPAVWVMGNRLRPTWGDQVMPDTIEIGELAANYLVSRGHSRLAFLNLDPEHWVLRAYGSAFCGAAEHLGVPVDVLAEKRSPSTDYWQPHSPEAVNRLADRFVSLDPRPTGVFIVDNMQIAMLQPALQQRGIRIGKGSAGGGGTSGGGGGGVELITCNNEEPYLIGLNPRPAVVDIRIESIGRRGVEQLAWRMKHRDTPERITSTIEPFVLGPEQQVVATPRREFRTAALTA